MKRKWTPQELDILEEMSEAYTPKQIAYRLRRRGYHRTTLAVHKKLYALGYSARPTLDNYSCNQIAQALSLNSSTVARWVRLGWLKAIRRSTRNYLVKSRDLKRFFKNPPQSIKKRIAAIDPQVVRYLVG
ncbi:hypothetical protein H6G91_23065 [Nostoc muscorum FACHB-395]|nr:hypothetical protein [Desmonostoc muscorum FACHB-395]